MRMQSQWQPGPSGVVGLRYEAMAFVMDIEEIPQKDRAAVMDEVQVMESTVLDIWHKKD